MLILHNISYSHPDKQQLFDQLSLSIGSHEKIALLGNNGVGKSTLLRLMAGGLQASGGSIHTDTQPYYVPQAYGQYDHLSVAQALRVDEKLNALAAILEGQVSEQNLAALNDDWTIEERCQEALHKWQLHGIGLHQKMAELSGGQKTKVFLAGITVHAPQLVLLDEPSNHLDAEGRAQLYGFISSTQAALLVVSHDRTLLSLLPAVYELSAGGIRIYGGSYAFYAGQKLIEKEALSKELQSKENALRQAKEIARNTMERKQRADARGKKKQEQAGLARIMMNTLRNNAERSTARLKHMHADKISDIKQDMQALRNELPDIDRMKLGFGDPALHTGKLLFRATGINYSYNKRLLWPAALDLELSSGERIVLRGTNGSGKTTLMRIVMGTLEPQQGTVFRSNCRVVYIDQDYQLLDNMLTVHEQAQQFNSGGFPDHEIRTRLNRFLFTQEHWDKPCSALSGGERMRLVLCCLSIIPVPPDLIMLDEPTNNLDIQNVGILTAAIRQYRGTLLLVSHDESFVEEIDPTRSIALTSTP